MPTKSAKQHKFMQAIAHGMKPRGGVGPSKDVAKEMLHGGKKDSIASKGKKSKSMWDKVKNKSHNPY